MAAHPTFDQHVRIPIEMIDKSQRETHECRFCSGTGRVFVGGGIGSRLPGFPRYMIRRIEQWFDTRLEGRVRIADLARSSGYSASHFFRMFRRSFGMTPHAYVMRRRLTVVHELLTRTDQCLAEIALKAGFCDQAHLSRAFRKSTGTTPRTFRTLNRVPRQVASRPDVGRTQPDWRPGLGCRPAAGGA
jgi:AraC-like DNA-binding protein